MSIRKLKKEIKNQTDISKIKDENQIEVDQAHKNVLKAIKTKADAYIFLAFRYFIPQYCNKCHKKDCYSYMDSTPAVITCVNCNNTTKINNLPIKDHVLLAQIILYYKITNKGIDRIAEVFKIKKSKVLKSVWWGLSNFIDNNDRLRNNTGRKTLLTNEVNYLTFKNRLTYDKVLLRFESRRSSQDN